MAGEGRITKVDPYPGTGADSDSGRFRLTPGHTAYLRISEGCSQRCTFCTIPDIRGPFRSKPRADVLAEARELAADGAVELNVIGQDTTAYGSDLPGESLPQLLRELNEVEGLRWIRLLYTYPRRFTDELIDAIAECERVVPYVDIPLQHISTSVLKRMGRQVTRADIEDLLGRLRDRVAQIVLRTTLIAGFPGETEREFQELLAFVNAFRFDALGVFTFSPEEGTAAAGMSDPIDDETRAARAEALMLAQQEIAFESNRRRVGSSLEILVDGAGPEGYCMGRYYGQAPDIDGVCILTEPREAGSFVQGRVTDWQDYDLIVEPR